MIPETKAGYGAMLLTSLAFGLNIARILLDVLQRPPDSALNIAASTTLTAAVGALVWVVHVNGGPR